MSTVRYFLRSPSKQKESEIRMLPSDRLISETEISVVVNSAEGRSLFGSEWAMSLECLGQNFVLTQVPAFVEGEPFAVTLRKDERGGEFIMEGEGFEFEFEHIKPVSKGDVGPIKSGLYVCGRLTLRGAKLKSLVQLKNYLTLFSIGFKYYDAAPLWDENPTRGKLRQIYFEFDRSVLRKDWFANSSVEQGLLGTKLWEFWAP